MADVGASEDFLNKEILSDLVACVMSKLASRGVYTLTSKRCKGCSKGGDDLRFEMGI
jgi:hypothetical protein